MDEVRAFMIENQLGRRNLTPEQTSYLRGLRYRDEKGERGKYNRSNHKGKNVPYEEVTSPEAPEIASERTNLANRASTAQKLAKQFNVNEKTIKRDAAFVAGVEKLAPELKAAVLSGKVTANKTILQQLGKSEVADGSITSLDAITADGSPTLPLSDQAPAPSAKADKRSATTTPDKLRGKLKKLTDQLSSSAGESIALYDDIISCATQLRAALLKK